MNEDNGHEPATLMPRYEGDTVLTLCTMIGGKQRFHQFLFTGAQCHSASQFDMMKQELSRMLAKLERERADHLRGRE